VLTIWVRSGIQPWDVRPKSKMGYLKRKIHPIPQSTDETKLLMPAQYQWFWAGTHSDTEILAPDMKHTVKRHVVVKRVVAVEELTPEKTSVDGIGSVEPALALENPSGTKESGEMNIATKQLPDGLHRIYPPHSNSLAHAFLFNFTIQVRKLVLFISLRRRGTDLSQGPSEKAIWPHAQTIPPK
jgi:hypothetical protein